MNSSAERMSAVMGLNHAATSAELYFRVSAWMRSRSNLTVQSIRDKFGVSRATAYRWIRAYRDSEGLQ